MYTACNAVLFLVAFSGKIYKSSKSVRRKQPGMRGWKSKENKEKKSAILRRIDSSLREDSRREDTYKRRRLFIMLGW